MLWVFLSNGVRPKRRAQGNCLLLNLLFIWEGCLSQMVGQGWASCLKKDLNTGCLAQLQGRKERKNKLCIMGWGRILKMGGTTSSQAQSNMDSTQSSLEQHRGNGVRPGRGQRWYAYMIVTDGNIEAQVWTVCSELHRSPMFARNVHEYIFLSWLETQRTAHTYTCMHIIVYRLPRGGGEGVCPSPQLCLWLSYHGNRLWLETTGERNHGVCFITSYELRFCHCLYMDIFKEYPGELCTVGRVNGLWWTTAETDCFIRRCFLQCSYYRVYSKLLVKTDLV